MTTEEYWQQYLDRDVFENFELTCDFFSKELPKDVLENYDVGEVILETVGDHINDKKFPQVFKFIDLLRERQPELYQEYFEYMDDFLVDYNCFLGDKKEAIRAFQNFLEHPVQEFDQFLQAFKTLRFYQYSELAELAVRQSYQKVRDSSELIGDAGNYLAICGFYFSLEKEYRLRNEEVDVDEVLSVSSGYDFNFDISLLNSMAKGLCARSLDVDYLQVEYEGEYENVLFQIEGNYLQFMAQKRFSFFLSGFFWDELLKYWFREDASGETLNERFEIDGSSFEEFIAGYHSWFIGDNKQEMAAVLWGSVYVYEFLFQAGLISREVFDDFCLIARRLKGKMIGLFVSGLWRFDFIHTWEKPECISEVEFEAERSIFRKSFSFPVGDFDSVKDEIIEELSQSGDLGSYIIEGAEKGFNEQKMVTDPLIEDGGFMHDFISSHEPVRVEKTPGRNDPCSCGSGKKYKKCCGK